MTQKIRLKLKNDIRHEESLNPSLILDTQESVAELFKVSLRTVPRWIKDGMPIIRSGPHAGKYNAADIQTWRGMRDKKKNGGNAPGKTNWKSKEEEYNARLKEIRLKEALGLLIPRKEVETGLTQACVVVKRALMTLPRTLAPILPGLDAREIEVVVREKVEDIINAFSSEQIFKTKANGDAGSRREANHLDRKRK